MKKAAWEIVRDNLERGVYSHTLNCGLETTGVAEADNQQVFVENLDEYVIKPLSMLKVS